MKFTKPYQVYKLIDYWKYIDEVASYGHVINHFIIMYVAIFKSISIIMCINILMLCLYYSVATSRLNSKAN